MVMEGCRFDLNPTVFGEDGKVEVGEYFGDDGDIWAGAITKCQQGEHSKMHKLTSCIRRQ